jgi:uncharacterized membrane protein HdeD (DUF308 family)
MAGVADAADQTQEMLAGMARSWGLIVALGVISIVIGVLAIGWPGKTIVAVAILFAIWLFVTGIMSVVQSFTRDGDTGMRVLHAIIGILSVIVGFALLRTPFQSVEVMIFVLGIFWVSQGIVTFITAFSSKQGRGWRLFMGGLGVLAGIVVLEYPIDSALTLAVLGGIWLVILGIMQVVAGFQLRSARA